MPETITFTGRARIEREDAPGTTKPFMVVIWDDDENEREERLERSFDTFIKAQKYARDLFDKKGLSFTPVPTSKPFGEWVEGRITGTI